jgi:hypothetical protein
MMWQFYEFRVPMESLPPRHPPLLSSHYQVQVSVSLNSSISTFNCVLVQMWPLH